MAATTATARRDARHPATGGASRPRTRLAAGAVLALVYAAPLLAPPRGGDPIVPPDAGLLVRLFPGVPAAWTGVRLLALAMAALLLAGPFSTVRTHVAGRPLRRARRMLARLAVALALAHAASAPWAGRLGTAGQIVYLACLAGPAALLAAAAATGRRLRRPAAAAAVAGALIVGWVVLRLATDLGSARVADAVDGWRGWVDVLVFTTGGKNVLVDPFDTALPGLGALAVVFDGLPAFRAGLPLGVPAVQAFQIAWLAIAGAGVAALAHRMVAPRAAVVAAAVFLFAPYTRFVALVPGPFLVGPILAGATALAAVAAVRRTSNAAVAVLGAAAGLSLGYPGLVPVAGALVAWTAWRLRGRWRDVGPGAAAGAASFAAAVLPLLPHVLDPARMTQHLRLHGAVGILEPVLLGQAPLADFARARATQVWRPLDVVAGALLAPFAHPRTSIRLWGDALFDPLGGVAIAVGLVACLRAVRTSPAARFVLLFFLAALCPAFVSPVDRVDVVHAVAFPVPAALLAAVGFDAVVRRLAPRARGAAAVVAAVVVAAGGTLLFDVVDPRILTASATGTLLRVLDPDAAARVVMLDYAPDASQDVRWLFTGPMTAYAGPRPVGYLPYPGGALPAADLASEGKTLLAWSPGLDRDLAPARAVCRTWPAAVLLDVRDPADRGHVYVARVGGPDWTPDAPRERWTARPCPPS